MAAGRHRFNEHRLATIIMVVSSVLGLVGAAFAIIVVAGEGAAHRPPSASGSRSPSRTASPVPTPRPAATTPTRPTAPASPKLLFGLGAEADQAINAKLVKDAPVKMLTSWYNGPNDLGFLTSWRTSTVPKAYAAGYALHLVVYTNDPERGLDTSHGRACGRAYPLSSRFVDDMRRLAQTFAGRADGPPLYVTLFTEFQTYPCIDNSWQPDAATTRYYQALKDQWRAAHRVFHQYAPNAKVSLGWGGWQAGFDDRVKAGGRSMFGHFADVMRLADFQSFQAMDSKDNTTDIAAMVKTLGGYGPVMLAHYKPDNGSQSTFDRDLRAVFTEATLRNLVRDGLFALSFMDTKNMTASTATYEFLKATVQRYAGGWG